MSQKSDPVPLSEPNPAQASYMVIDLEVNETLFLESIETLEEIKEIFKY